MKKIAWKQTMGSTCHRDGTVSYWSIYNQVWTRSRLVPDCELAAMGAAERARVRGHVVRASGRREA